MAWTDNISAYGDAATNLFIIIFALLFILALLAGAFWLYQKNRLYNQYHCIIWERDGFGQLTQKHDTAGIFVDKKTNNKRFFMKKANVGLVPDNIPFVPGPKGVLYVYMLRSGLKNFAFINPQVKPQGDVLLSVGEEDVNWAINAYERQKKIFQSNWLMQYLPFIALAFVSIIILIVFIYFFRNFDTLVAAAEALKEAAKQLALAKTGALPA